MWMFVKIFSHFYHLKNTCLNNPRARIFINDFLEFILLIRIKEFKSWVVLIPEAVNVAYFLPNLISNMLDIVTKLSYNFNLINIFKKCKVVILFSCLGISSLFTQLTMTVFPSTELFSCFQHILTELL